MQVDALLSPASPFSSPRQNGTTIADAHTEASLSGVAPTVTATTSLISVQSSPSLSTVNGVTKDKAVDDNEREKLLYPSRVMLTSEFPPSNVVATSSSGPCHHQILMDLLAQLQ